ncbi:hypothetical protein [Microbacterium sp. 69-7]|uniref:hypothetical protein n=1 Tax=Microbacterium sp. 69-7 TaxID=1895784 RepID=UPI000AD24F66|nr:hypothetical protein [Microbacterium sp. 69-7]
MTAITEEKIDALRALQKQIGDANGAKGFHEEGQEVRGMLPVFISTAGKWGTLSTFMSKLFRLHPAIERNYWTSRLALITTEVAEAIEELRHGRSVDETHYPSAPLGGNAIHETGAPAKPEGVPSELADIVIRAFDFAYEANIDLASMINEKLAYNATRAHKHGKEF